MPSPTSFTNSVHIAPIANAAKTRRTCTLSTSIRRPKLLILTSNDRGETFCSPVRPATHTRLNTSAMRASRAYCDATYGHISTTRFLHSRITRMAGVSFDIAAGTHRESCGVLTIEMIGLLKSPAVALRYRDLSIAYDGASKRQQAWKIARQARLDYQSTPTNAMRRSIVTMCLAQGHFSIWMHVFRAHPLVRRAICAESQAASDCFDLNGNPCSRGRC